ncbi:uncharacterized protein [Fopius arisanus]|uniref:Uncharacterized protein isoform X2 n=1 Tax=Fopius arisanus TaxID=64838 RepID=A0A9R1TPG2_9HYME|nr:PREDICTED: uncharacterized protein LOC105272514 isoform X2 [Fopius arisanus]
MSPRIPIMSQAINSTSQKITTESVTLLNCLQCIGNLIGYFIRLFLELFLLILTGIISQISGFGLFTRILAPVLLMGFILMNIFPFQPLTYCTHRRIINQSLYEIFEVHLLNAIHPPVTARTSNSPRENSTFPNITESGKAVLRIIFNETSPNQGIHTEGNIPVKLPVFSVIPELNV